ncbi:MAG: leucine-rich repeat domain-containing protein, partial [Clostridia bacterium]|nr:leucine-rich repeat domain-containing protein [Clostridia bacterium]
MEKIKSIISILLVSMMLFAVAAAGIGSASAAETNYNGGIIQYTVTDGKATITNVVGTDSDITVPATLDGYPVVAIGELAYRDEHNLKSVVIPANIETIGKSAFTGCIALETVTFADGSKVKTIEETAFNACKSLKTVNFGSNGALETIGRSAFVNCTALETFNPPASLKTIDATVFEGCTSLKDVTVSANVENIGNGAFAKCEALENFKVDPANANFTTDTWGILYNKDKTMIVAYPA